MDKHFKQIQADFFIVYKIDMKWHATKIKWVYCIMTSWNEFIFDFIWWIIAENEWGDTMFYLVGLQQ